MFNRITPMGVFLFGWFLSAGEVVTQAGVVTFLNDYEGFLTAAGDVRTIDFETLPDGSPSYADPESFRGPDITPDFNYTIQGVTFSSPTDLYIAGSTIPGFFGLVASGYAEYEPTWIIAEFAPTASAVGVFFGRRMELSAFDAGNNLIGAAAYQGLPSETQPYFVGIVSDEPIVRIIADEVPGYSVTSAIWDFAFTPIPEPTTLMLLLAGTVATVRRRLNQ